MNFVLSILTLVMFQHGASCQSERKETIPLNHAIEITITSIDSTFLDHYDIYTFNYQNVPAQFWVLKSDTSFDIGEETVQLCRIIQMKTGDNINLRGCAFYNGLTILEDEAIVRQFNFDEYSESPCLRLCTSD